jgi:hypothetical protein
MGCDGQEYWQQPDRQHHRARDLRKRTVAGGGSSSWHLPGLRASGDAVSAGSCSPPKSSAEYVERVASERIGRETVTYVSNIYKYYIAYQLLSAQRDRRDAAKAEVMKRQ